MLEDEHILTGRGFRWLKSDVIFSEEHNKVFVKLLCKKCQSEELSIYIGKQFLLYVCRNCFHIEAFHYKVLSMIGQMAEKEKVEMESE